MTDKPDLLQLIRQAMNSKSTAATNKTPNGKGVQRTKKRPPKAIAGQLGDFSRSNSNPPSRTVNNLAPVGFEDMSGAGDGSLLAVIRLSLTHLSTPSKRQVKHMSSPKMTRPDRVFQLGKGCGPGSSKSPTLSIIKAIAAQDTGCIVREQMKGKDKQPLKPLTLSESQKNANTTQGNYNPMIVR